MYAFMYVESASLITSIAVDIEDCMHFSKKCLQNFSR